MKIILLFVLLTLSLGVKASNNSDLGQKNNIIQCAKIKDNNKRLACFDAVAEGQIKTSNASAAQPTPQPLGLPPLQQDAIVLSKQDLFGKKIEEINQLDKLTSTIIGEFKGWKKGAIIKLANGQKWKVTSRSVGYVRLTDPKVVISRGFLGSFNIKVEGLNAKAKVKRIK